MRDENKNMKKVLVVAIIAAAVVTLLFSFIVEKWVAAMLLIIMTLYVVVFLVFNYSDSKIVETFVGKYNRMHHVNSFITTLFLSFLVTIVLMLQTNQIEQQQVEITERDTSPLFRLDVDQEAGIQKYILSNEKGIASYVTLYIFESYHFSHNGESYEFNLLFSTEEENNKYNMDSKCKKLIFIPEYQSFNREETYNIVREYVEEKIGREVIVSNSREIKLNFFDYKNEYFSFVFNEYDEEIKLSSTDTHIYSPPHNTTMQMSPYDDVEAVVSEGMDYIFGM